MLVNIVNIKLRRASDVSLKRAKTFPKSQDIFPYSKYSKYSKSKYRREAQFAELGDTFPYAKTRRKNLTYTMYTWFVSYDSRRIFVAASVPLFRL